jgi:uncharacterized membrane protein
MICHTGLMRQQVSRLALLGAMLLGAAFAGVTCVVAITGAAPGVPLLMNLQILSGVVVTAGLAVLAALDRSRQGIDLATLMVPLLLLFAGSAEIDRYAVQQSAAPAWIVRQAGWSVYWSTLAVVCIVAGFVWSWRPLRLMALGLLAITLLKVVVIDLAGAGTGWRILSFIGLGALLLGTSVLYGKFSKQFDTR